MSGKTINIEGIVEKVTYYNSENGYSVFTVADPANEDEKAVTCVGYAPAVEQGETVRVSGTRGVHPVYGEQLNIEMCEKTEPRSENAILLYLSSGIIKGIRKRTARKIVDKFGASTLDIMEKEPERLAEISGISRAKARTIGETYKEKVDERNVMMFLAEHNVSATNAIKIYKHYKNRTIEVVKTNPYALADDIFGIGFKRADVIARNVGVSRTSPDRIKAGIKYQLGDASNRGHVFLPEAELLTETAKLLGIDRQLIGTELTSMQIDGQIYVDRSSEYVHAYLNQFYYAEGYTARKIYELSTTELAAQKDYDKEIDAVESAENISFAPQQRSAINAAMKNGVLIITGGPGTGKTTIINAIIKLCEAEGLEIDLAAPTGRAAKRMEEATGHEASTIHRLLGIGYSRDNSSSNDFERDEDNPLESDVVIIDESSMIDILLMHSLLKAIPQGTRLILVGDSNQLPSVGPGNVLRDIINSGVIKVCRLTEIFRQAQESDIIINAHRINRGEYPDLRKNDKDFFFMRRTTPEDVRNLVVGLVSQRLPRYLNCDPLRDIQVLTPTRMSKLGVPELNKLLQEVLNPPSPLKNEKKFGGNIFREGDKVMQIRNNYDAEWIIKHKNGKTEDGTGVFNGDEGIISRIDTEDEFVEVVYEDNKIVRYDFSQMNEVDLSYAVTIHKSQGSEYKAVVMPLFDCVPLLKTRNLLYTGLTRAKELAVIVGLESTVREMVDNNREVQRNTNLCQRLRKFAELDQDD